MSTNNRVPCLSAHPCEPESFKEALYCATHHQPSKPFAQVADECGAPKNFKDQVNPHDPDWPVMRILPGICAATKERPVIAQYLARLQGGVFVPIPERGGTHAELFESSAQVMRRVADTTTGIGQALADDSAITHDEVPAIERAIDALHVAAEELRAAVRRSAVARRPQSVDLKVAVGGRR